MKRNLLTLTLAAAGLLVGTGAFAASSTHDLAVSASVTGTCKFENASGATLAIGHGGAAIDPSSSANAVGSTSVNWNCTKNTALGSIVAGNGNNFSGGSRRVSNGGTEYMAYSLTLGAGCAAATSGTGFSSWQSCAVAGEILPAAFQNAAAGSYSDTVQLTIAP